MCWEFVEFIKWDGIFADFATVRLPELNSPLNRTFLQCHFLLRALVC